MNFIIILIINSIALGVGLAMDAFSVSMANGLNDPGMKKKQIFEIAGMFAFCQFIMPLIGWICVHTIVNIFGEFELFIPWIALILLGYIGIKMILDGVKESDKDEEGSNDKLTLGVLIVQGIATSIDALSVGFTIADYTLLMAFVSALIIAVVTFFICVLGVNLGKKFGTKLAGKSQILGGSILIIIGLEIFIKGIFF